MLLSRSVVKVTGQKERGNDPGVGEKPEGRARKKLVRQ
jgi:hypothetical protein